MQLTTPLLPLLTLLLTTLPLTDSLAIPAAIRPNESSCKAHSHGLVISYTVKIGRAYSLQKCENVYPFMQKHGGVPSAMRCTETRDGTFQFKFNNLRKQEELINDALNRNWPVIARNGGFNCPGY